MGKNNIIINLKDISFAYPSQENLFRNLNLRLSQGEKIGLIGDNGSGKTTLLHLIMGILPISSGKLEIFGRTIRSPDDFREARRKVGLLFQHSDDQLFCPTVLEDVAFGPLNLGKKPAEARRIALRTLKALNLEGFENKITHQLSGGEKKLAALATILAMEPRALLLDEPTSGLDGNTRKRLSAILKNLDAGYILVSHQYEFLAENTGEIYGLKDGRLEFYGQSSALHSHYHLHSAGEIPHKHDSIN